MCILRQIWFTKAFIDCGKWTDSNLFAQMVYIFKSVLFLCICCCFWDIETLEMCDFCCVDPSGLSIIEELDEVEPMNDWTNLSFWGKEQMTKNLRKGIKLCTKGRWVLDLTMWEGGKDMDDSPVVLLAWRGTDMNAGAVVWFGCRQLCLVWTFVTIDKVFEIQLSSQTFQPFSPSSWNQSSSCCIDIQKDPGNVRIHGHSFLWWDSNVLAKSELIVSE